MAVNSLRGSFYTDNGPWSAGAAKALGKDHGLCTKHECNAIPDASAGHDEKRHQCMSDLNALIYHCTSVNKLEDKLTECRIKYGHVPATAKFLDSLEENKKKLCRAYTQNIYIVQNTQPLNVVKGIMI